MSELDSTDQSTLDPHRELNRYDGRHEEWPSEAVFAPPRRTLAEGWRKFHANRECGSEAVSYHEGHTITSAHDEKGAYRLICRSCGHRVPEDEVLFIGGEWYREHGWLAYCGSLEDLKLPNDRVLELGPDPSHDELVDALNLTRIEQGSGPHPCAGLQRDSWRACETCENEVPMQFDGRCRMCYDGPWTDRMMDGLAAFERTVRTWVNDSFVHRLESKIDPFAIGDRAHTDTVLWRKPSDHDAPKLAVIERCLQDSDTDQWAYVIRNPADDSERLLTHDELGDWYYDTGLHVDSEVEGISDERLRGVAGRYV